MLTFFVSNGINVNDPAFGRWVNAIDHNTWHNKSSPKFNDFWKDFIEDEDGLPIALTINEILDKLAEARSRYPVTN